MGDIDGNRGWVVQKFGGTSVGKFPHKVSPFATLVSLSFPHEILTTLNTDCP
jgi:hypothetical protein